LAGVEVFACAEPIGDGSLDCGLDGAGAVVGGQIGGEVVSSVGETKADGRGFVEGLVRDLGPYLASVDAVGPEVINDRAVRCCAVLPASAGYVWAVRLHWPVPDHGPGRATLWTRSGVGVEVGATAGTHDAFTLNIDP